MMFYLLKTTLNYFLNRRENHFKMRLKTVNVNVKGWINLNIKAWVSWGMFLCALVSSLENYHTFSEVAGI